MRRYGIIAVITNGARSEFVRDSRGTLIGQTTPSGENLYAVTDYQGSTLALIDGAQNAAARYSYTPYGTTGPSGRAAADNPFRWIGGMQLDENHGTYTLGYRQYDPYLARFTQTDPSGQEPNPYTYGLGNPCTNTDASGLASIFTDVECSALDNSSFVAGGISLGLAIGGGVATGTILGAPVGGVLGIASGLVGGYGFLATAGYKIFC